MIKKREVDQALAIVYTYVSMYLYVFMSFYAYIPLYLGIFRRNGEPFPLRTIPNF